jgi:endonuclease/exonuclease/phosphatase family metal-dependent hydrolase
MANIMMLVIATWNIGGGKPLSHSKWDHRNRDMLAPLRDVAPDLLALQEVEFDHEGQLMEGIGQAIPGTIGHEYVVAFPMSRSHHTEGRMLGVVVTSRWPITSALSFMLPNPHLRIDDGESGSVETHDKGFIAALVSIDGWELVVTSLHSFPFHSFGRSAHEEELATVWKALACEIDGLASPLLFAGDFNTEDRALVTSRLRTRRLAAATTGLATRPSGASHDDVLFSDDFRLRRSYAVETFSDHHLVVVEVTTRH